MKVNILIVVSSLLFLFILPINAQQSVKGNVLGDDGNALPFANAY